MPRANNCPRCDSVWLRRDTQVTVVRAGRLIDPDSATMLTDQEILIVGNKVTAVGKQLRVPKDAKWIDLSDKTILPG